MKKLTTLLMSILPIAALALYMEGGDTGLKNIAIAYAWIMSLLWIVAASVKDSLINEVKPESLMLYKSYPSTYHYFLLTLDLVLALILAYIGAFITLSAVVLSMLCEHYTKTEISKFLQEETDKTDE